LHFVYILFSAALDRYYIGSSENPEMRLTKHLANHEGFTARAKDWQLVYKESFQQKAESLKRERQLKNWKSRIRIKRLIDEAEGLEHPDL